MGIEQEFRDRLEEILADPSSAITGEVRRFLELSLLASRGLLEGWGVTDAAVDREGRAGFRIEGAQDPSVRMLVERHNALQGACLRLAEEVDVLRRRLSERADAPVQRGA